MFTFHRIFFFIFQLYSPLIFISSIQSYTRAMATFSAQQEKHVRWERHECQREDQTRSKCLNASTEADKSISSLAKAKKNEGTIHREWCLSLVFKLYNVRSTTCKDLTPISPMTRKLVGGFLLYNVMSERSDVDLSKTLVAFF